MGVRTEWRCKDCGMPRPNGEPWACTLKYPTVPGAVQGMCRLERVLVVDAEPCPTCQDGCECGPQGSCKGPYPCPSCHDLGAVPVGGGIESWCKCGDVGCDDGRRVVLVVPSGEEGR